MPCRGNGVGFCSLALCSSAHSAGKVMTLGAAWGIRGQEGSQGPPC